MGSDGSFTHFSGSGFWFIIPFFSFLIWDLSKKVYGGLWFSYSRGKMMVFKLHHLGYICECCGILFMSFCSWFLRFEQLDFLGFCYKIQPEIFLKKRV